MRYAPFSTLVALLLAAGCGQSEVPQAMTPPGEEGASVIVDSAEVSLLSRASSDRANFQAPLPSGILSTAIQIEVQDPGFTAFSLQLERQGTSVTFRRLFLPQLLSSEAVYFAASFWSQPLDLGGVSYLTGPGLGQTCVIIRNRLQPGRPELTRSTGCTTSPPPPSPQSLQINQVSLTARRFALTQNRDTGVIGFGPVAGPGAPTDDFDGPGSSAAGPVAQSCGASTFFPNSSASPPRLVVDEGNGAFLQVFEGVLAPTTTLQTPVVLADQRLSVFQDQNGFLQLAITPGNFDELYRINFFEDQPVNLRLARCVTTPGEMSTDDQGNVTSVAASEQNLEFDNAQGTFRLLESAQALFTLRGTAGGINEPNAGRLLGAQFTSDLPLPQGLISSAETRFSGVLNLQDVSGNPLRSDISFVIDQIEGQITRTAQRELDLGVGDSNPPFISINGCPATADSGLICGRFQINQPFVSTSANDVLVISGTFVGLGSL